MADNKQSLIEEVNKLAAQNIIDSGLNGLLIELIDYTEAKNHGNALAALEGLKPAIERIASDIGTNQHLMQEFNPNLHAISENIRNLHSRIEIERNKADAKSRGMGSGPVPPGNINPALVAERNLERITGILKTALMMETTEEQLERLLVPELGPQLTGQLRALVQALKTGQLSASKRIKNSLMPYLNERYKGKFGNKADGLIDNIGGMMSFAQEAYGRYWLLESLLGFFRLLAQDDFDNANELLVGDKSRFIPVDARKQLLSLLTSIDGRDFVKLRKTLEALKAGIHKFCTTSRDQSKGGWPIKPETFDYSHYDYEIISLIDNLDWKYYNPAILVLAPLNAREKTPIKIYNNYVIGDDDALVIGKGGDADIELADSGSKYENQALIYFYRPSEKFYVVNANDDTRIEVAQSISGTPNVMPPEHTEGGNLPRLPQHPLFDGESMSINGYIFTISVVTDFLPERGFKDQFKPDRLVLHLETATVPQVTPTVAATEAARVVVEQPYYDEILQNVEDGYYGAALNKLERMHKTEFDEQLTNSIIGATYEGDLFNALVFIPGAIKSKKFDEKQKAILIRLQSILKELKRKRQSGEPTKAGITPLEVRVYGEMCEHLRNREYEAALKKFDELYQNGFTKNLKSILSNAKNNLDWTINVFSEDYLKEFDGQYQDILRKIRDVLMGLKGDSPA